MPKLLYADASPYARKVRVVAAEKGLAHFASPEVLTLSPVKPHDGVAAANPLGKVPCLVLDDGTAIYDSRVICAFLETQAPAPRLYPEGQARIAALTLEALADGLLDAALLWRYENMLRPGSLRWAAWSDGQWAKVLAALAALEGQAAGFGGRVDIGTIAVAAALGYLDFRFADRAWRDGRPQLAAWFEGFAARPSMVSTRPAG